MNLRSRPASTAHRFDDGSGREVVEVACGSGDAGVAELAGDDGDVHAFGAELGGVGVAEAVGVDASVDARPGGETFEHNADVGVGHRVAAERAEDGIAAAQTEAGRETTRRPVESSMASAPALPNRTGRQRLNSPSMSPGSSGQTRA